MTRSARESVADRVEALWDEATAEARDKAAVGEPYMGPTFIAALKEKIAAALGGSMEEKPKAEEEPKKEEAPKAEAKAEEKKPEPAGAHGATASPTPARGAVGPTGPGSTRR